MFIETQIEFVSPQQDSSPLRSFLAWSQRSPSTPATTIRQRTSLSEPSRQGLELVSFFELALRDRVIGGLAAYDDPTTIRRVDSLALHDTEGELLMFGWFDRFGIERVAADRGFLEGKNALEGVFVVLLKGHSV